MLYIIHLFLTTMYNLKEDSYTIIIIILTYIVFTLCLITYKL